MAHAGMWARTSNCQVFHWSRDVYDARAACAAKAKADPTESCEAEKASTCHGRTRE